MTTQRDENDEKHWGVYSPLLGHTVFPLDSYHQPACDGITYVNILPDDFERIRLMVRAELDEALASLLTEMTGRLRQG